MDPVLAAEQQRWNELHRVAQMYRRNRQQLDDSAISTPSPRRRFRTPQL
jgi:hypothetical protein